MQCKMFTQVDNFNFEIDVEKVMAFHNAECRFQNFKKNV